MTTPRSHAIYAAQGAYSLFIHRAYVSEGFEAPSNLEGYRFTDSRSGYVVILRRNGACDATATRLANLPGAEPVEAAREEVAAIRQGIETRKRAPQRPEEGPRVIDMTPTWAGLAPALFLALTNGTPEGQRIAREELTRALAALDAHNAAAKAAQRPEMPDAQRAQISARLDRASVGNLRAYAFATLAHGQDVPEAAEDNLPGFAQPVTA